MRTNLLILILFIASRPIHAADGRDDGWIRGSFVEVSAENSVKEVNEYDNSRPIGHPAFQKLAIRKGESADSWIVTGVVCSTNAGGPVQGAAIYVGYPGGHFQLIAMSNRIGEVLFSVSPSWGSDAKPVVPTHVYIASHPIMSPSLKGATLRQYALRSTN